MKFGFQSFYDAFEFVRQTIRIGNEVRTRIAFKVVVIALPTIIKPRSRGMNASSAIAKIIPGESESSVDCLPQPRITALVSHQFLPSFESNLVIVPKQIPGLTKCPPLGHFCAEGTFCIILGLIVQGNGSCVKRIVDKQTSPFYSRRVS